VSEAIALEQASMGHYVFPCKLDKTPYTPHGCKDATTDPNIIRKWWQIWPEAQVGIFCEPSALIVFDFDDINTYNDLKRESPELFEHTLVVTTGRGGKHVYYNKPKGMTIKTKSVGTKNECIRGLPGVDVRADKNGYIIAPGCKNKNGPYVIDVNLPPIELPPYWLLKLYDNDFIEGHGPRVETKIIEVTPKREISGDVIGAQYWVDKYSSEARKGNRNSTGNMLATQLKALYEAGKISMGEAERYMVEYQRSVDSSSDPYTEKEALATLDYNFSRYPAKEPVKIHEDPRKAVIIKPPEAPGPEPEAIIAPSVRGYNLTDLGNAERLRDMFNGEIKYCYKFGKWYVWNSQYWEMDEGALIPGLSKRTVRQMLVEAADIDDLRERRKLTTHSLNSESNSRINAMISLAQSEVPIKEEQLNTHKYKINVKNGTLDLKTCQLLPYNKEDYITKMANVEYNKDATCPLFVEFLNLIFNGNQNIIKFIQKALGISLTGDCGEQVIFILWGQGNNGKTTLMSLINKLMVMGHYADNIPAESLMVNKYKDDKHNDLAKLPGIRFLTVSEGEEEGRLNESLIKQMTGGDPITCRFLFHELFTYIPEFKIWYYTNHKPDINGIDEGIWRRILMIPFTVNVVDKLKKLGKPRIPNYENFLYEREAEGIFNWIVQGWTAYKNEGLNPPAEVLAAIDDYKKSMDPLQKWIDEECIAYEPGNDNIRESFSNIYNTYNHWAGLNGETTFKAKALAKRLDDKGLRTIKGSHNVKFRIGILINPELLVTDSYSKSTKLDIINACKGHTENESLSVTGNPTSNLSVTDPIVNDEPLQIVNDDDQATRRKHLIEVILLQSAQIEHNAAPLPAILDAMKAKGYSESKVERDIKALKEIGEIMEHPKLQGFNSKT
jgi:P4 family phage/plasmid primase-like protien